MINEEKVILMTHASLYENGEGKKQMKIADYYRHDYISVRLLLGWFWGTVGFVAMLALWVFCKMEYLMENLHSMESIRSAIRRLKRVWEHIPIRFKKSLGSMQKRKK